MRTLMKTYFLTPLLALLLILGLTACGKKGPPVTNRKKNPYP